MNDTQLILTMFAAVGLGTPLIFATVGEIITERAGILNLGVQGMMLIGAVTGFWEHSKPGISYSGSSLQWCAEQPFRPYTLSRRSRCASTRSSQDSPLPCSDPASQASSEGQGRSRWSATRHVRSSSRSSPAGLQTSRLLAHSCSDMILWCICRGSSQGCELLLVQNQDGAFTSCCWGGSSIR